jgi:hypothetical protein
LVRSNEVHGGEAHGAVPSTQPVLSDTKVTETGVKPLGTGPPGGPAWGTVVTAAGGATVEGTVVGEGMVVGGIVVVDGGFANFTVEL